MDANVASRCHPERSPAGGVVEGSMRQVTKTSSRAADPSTARQRRFAQDDILKRSCQLKTHAAAACRVLNAEAQRRGDAENFPEDSFARRGPGRQPAACAIAQVSPPSSPLLQSRKAVTNARQIRHAGGVPDGGMRGDCERWRSEAPRFSPATGDRRSSVDLPPLTAPSHNLGNRALASLRLCVPCVLCGSTMCTRDACTTMVVQPSRLHSGCTFAMASVSFCVFCQPFRQLSVFPLCVSVPPWFSWCGAFVSLCLRVCGVLGWVHLGNQWAYPVRLPSIAIAIAIAMINLRPSA